MNRITPEEVIAAYKKLGLKPRTGRSDVNESNQCCGYGALYQDDASVKCKYNGSGPLYLKGYFDGFDNLSLSDSFNSATSYIIGYEDGQTSRNACIKEFGEFS